MTVDQFKSYVKSIVLNSIKSYAIRQPASIYKMEQELVAFLYQNVADADRKLIANSYGLNLNHMLPDIEYLPILAYKAFKESFETLN